MTFPNVYYGGHTNLTKRTKMCVTYLSVVCLYLESYENTVLYRILNQPNAS